MSSISGAEHCALTLTRNRRFEIPASIKGRVCRRSSHTANPLCSTSIPLLFPSPFSEGIIIVSAPFVCPSNIHCRVVFTLRRGGFTWLASDFKADSDKPLCGGTLSFAFTVMNSLPFFFFFLFLLLSRPVTGGLLARTSVEILPDRRA